MPAETLIFDAYTAYLALVKAAVPATVSVYDGPQALLPTDQQFIVVGCEDPTQQPPAPITAVDTGSQEYVSLGAGQRQETFRIWAVLVVADGDGGFAAARDTAKTIISDIAAAVRPGPAGMGDGMLGNVLNQAGAGTGWCGLAVTRMQQVQNSSGSQVYVPLALDCLARI